jgi:hypothetical protein
MIGPFVHEARLGCVLSAIGGNVTVNVTSTLGQNSVVSLGEIDCCANNLTVAKAIIINERKIFLFMIN